MFWNCVLRGFLKIESLIFTVYTSVCQSSYQLLIDSKLPFLVRNMLEDACMLSTLDILGSNLETYTWFVGLDLHLL